MSQEIGNAEFGGDASSLRHRAVVDQSDQFGRLAQELAVGSSLILGHGWLLNSP